MRVRLFAVFLALMPVLRAADLKPETVQMWDSYIADIRASAKADAAAASHPFLSLDGQAEQLAKVKLGQIVAYPTMAGVPKKAPHGLIHDWSGAAFIPHTSLAAVLAVVRDYEHYKAFYKPTVIESKSVDHAPFEDKFSMVLMDHSLLSKAALETDYETVYTALDEKRWYGLVEATRIQEVENYGGDAERKIPLGHGRGFIWRLFSVTKFEERDGGVYIEVQAVVLSRDIPATFHFFVDPIVRKVSRNSLTTSLKQTRDAVTAASQTTSKKPASGSSVGQ